MAQTKIWDTSSPYKVIWYITQDQKVKPAPDSPLRYVSCIGCFSGEDKFAVNIAKQFQAVKKRFHKTDGVQVYHAEQSFLRGEVTPEEAHEIGVQMAKELWPGFQVVVATHLDTGTIHNHFCFNSVSYADGHKFHDSLKSYAHMREVSDRICKERGLSTIDVPSTERHKNYRTWLREKEGQENVTVRSWIKEDIDKLLPSVASLPELYQRMEEIGYTVDASGKYAKVRPAGKERFFRLYKLGKGYAEEELYDRINKNLDPNYREPDAKPIWFSAYTSRRVFTMRYLSIRFRCRPSSLRYTYTTLLHLIRKMVRGNYPSPYPSVGVREAARDLQRFSEKTMLLCSNNIHTVDQLAAYKEGLAEKAKALASDRQSLRSKLASASEAEVQEDLRIQIAAITSQIKVTGKEQKLCDEITQEAQEVAAMIQRELGRMEQEQEKSQEEQERNDVNECGS